MSILKTAMLAISLSLLFGGSAMAGDKFYDPATGEQVYTAQGDCVPGEDFGGQKCTCQKKRGQYFNCAFRAVGAAPTNTWWNCFSNPYVQYHQECLAYGQQGNAGYSGNHYNQGGYQRPGSPFYTSSPPSAPGYSSTYYCSGRRGDRRCDQMPRQGF